MRDHLERVVGPVRLAGVIAASVAALLLWTMVSIVVLIVIDAGGMRHEHIGLVMGGVLFAALGLYCTILSWRLWSKKTSANGYTVMPAWTIQVFGVFLLLGLAGSAVWDSDPLFLVEGGIFALAMIFVGRNIAARQRRARKNIPPAPGR